MPTQKQKIVFKDVMENHTALPVAMKEAGYSDSFSANPQELTRSQGWNELLEKHIPDELLTQKHRELLDAKDKDGNTDYSSIRSGVDMGYKLKGKYAAETKVVLNVDTVSPEALELAKQILEQRRNKTSAGSNGAISEPMGREV